MATYTIGTYTDHGERRRVTIDAEITADTLLHISGEVRGRDSYHSGGQCIGELERVTDYAPGWNAAKVARLADVWRTWHLNDMRAGCEHQRAAGWDKQPIYTDKPIDAYVKHPDGLDGWNMAAWLPARYWGDDYPALAGRPRPYVLPGDSVVYGLLGAPCPECGYKYGSRWLREELPTDVIAFIAALGDAAEEEAE